MRLKMRFDGKVETVLLTYDTANNSSHISRNLHVLDFVFCAGNVNKAMFVSDLGTRVGYIDSSGTFLKNPSLKEWVSPLYDMGVSGKNKFLYKVSLYSKNPLTLTVVCDNKTLVYNLMGGGYNEVYPSLRGELFRISLKDKTSSPKISNLSLYVEYVKEKF